MTTTTTFNYTGALQSFVVPPGVTAVTTDGYGAAAWNGGTQGRGGRLQGVLAVTPGQTLYISIGGQGGTPGGAGGGNPGLGGFNGGGDGGASTGTGGTQGGGGGGATDIRVGGTALANRVCVAGGGGSSGRNTGAGAGGDGGGTTGHAGGIGGASGAAGGGTPSAGGAAGTGGVNGTAGASGQAGKGGSTTTTNANAGSGGGGGYFGGGGGAGMASGSGSGGGGGGSNFAGTMTGVTHTQGYSVATGHGSLTLTYNQPPTPPVLISPTNNSHTDRTVTTTLAWTFSDPDTGDTQSAADVQYRAVGAGSWTTIVGAVSGAASAYNIAPSTFADATQYEWQVQTYDNVGQASGWSASSFFTAHTPPTTATITAPAGTITANPVSVSWTIAGTQIARQIRVVADNGSGTADPTIVYADSGQVNSSVHAAVTQALGSTPQGGHAHVQVRYQQFAGVWSAWADSGNLTVNVGAPGIPTLVLNPSAPTGVIQVLITNPGTPNPTTTQDLYRTNVDEVPLRMDYASQTSVPSAADTLHPNWPYLPNGANTVTMLGGKRGLNFASAGAAEEWQFWAFGRKINRMRCEFQIIGGGASDGQTLVLGAFTIFKTSSQTPDSHGYLTLGRTTWSFSVVQSGATTVVASGTYTSLPLNTVLAAELLIDPINGRFTAWLPDGSIAAGSHTAIAQVAGTYLGSGTAVAAGNTDKKIYVMNAWATDGTDFGEVRISTGIGSGGSYLDYTPGSGVQYRYRVQAYAAFGGSASSL